MVPPRGEQPPDPPRDFLRLQAVRGPERVIHCECPLRGGHRVRELEQSFVEPELSCDPARDREEPHPRPSVGNSGSFEDEQVRQRHGFPVFRDLGVLHPRVLVGGLEAHREHVRRERRELQLPAAPVEPVGAVLEHDRGVGGARVERGPCGGGVLHERGEVASRFRNWSCDRLDQWELAVHAGSGDQAAQGSVRCDAEQALRARSSGCCRAGRRRALAIRFRAGHHVPEARHR